MPLHSPRWGPRLGWRGGSEAFAVFDKWVQKASPPQASTTTTPRDPPPPPALPIPAASPLLSRKQARRPPHPSVDAMVLLREPPLLLFSRKPGAEAAWEGWLSGGKKPPLPSSVGRWRSPRDPAGYNPPGESERRASKTLGSGERPPAAAAAAATTSSASSSCLE